MKTLVPTFATVPLARPWTRSCARRGGLASQKHLTHFPPSGDCKGQTIRFWRIRSTRFSALPHLKIVRQWGSQISHPCIRLAITEFSRVKARLVQSPSKTGALPRRPISRGTLLCTLSQGCSRMRAQGCCVSISYQIESWCPGSRYRNDSKSNR